MDGDDMLVLPLDESTDGRGWSFSILEHHLDAIGKIRDVHMATIHPGCIRGNHFHEHRGELIAVVFNDEWSLHWDTGEGTKTHHRTFLGSGAIAFAPPRNWSHAVRNDGKVDVVIFAASDAPYDRHDTDAQKRDAVSRIVTDDDLA